MHTIETARKRRFNTGFTIIEVMIVVAIVAILASIAVPGYQNYIRKSHAKAAAGDLIALGLVMENLYQRQLSYLNNPASGSLVALPTTTTDDTLRYVNGIGDGNALPANSLWQPAESNLFTYTLTVPTSGANTGLSYTLTATGRNNTTSSGCVLTLNNANTRTANGNNGCGGLTSW